MFDVHNFYDDYGIDYYEGDYHHQHCREGWTQTECPRCSGNPGLHLGFSGSSGQFVCWRCGFMPIIEAIRLFLGVSWPEAKRIAKKYGGEKVYHKYERAPKEKNIKVMLPTSTLDSFPKRHRQYLEERNFDPDKLIDLWDLKATGKKGVCKYKNRILAPYYYRNTLMSYQTRALKNIEPRYMACSMDNERRHHKYCLYGIDMCLGKSVLVVEGITDVWRMGIGAVSTSGIKYTETQVLLLAKHFENVFVLYDETEQVAQDQAKKLSQTLSTMGKYSEHITLGIDHDPAELSDKDAKYLMRELLIK